MEIVKQLLDKHYSGEKLSGSEMNIVNNYCKGKVEIANYNILKTNNTLFNFFALCFLETNIGIDYNETTAYATLKKTSTGYRPFVGFNPSLVYECDSEELAFLIVHEMNHLVRFHCNKGYFSDLKSKELLNIAMDCIINTVTETDAAKRKGVVKEGITIITFDKHQERLDVLNKKVQEVFDKLKGDNENKSPNTNDVTSKKGGIKFPKTSEKLRKEGFAVCYTPKEYEGVFDVRSIYKWLLTELRDEYNEQQKQEGGQEGGDNNELSKQKGTKGKPDSEIDKNKGEVTTSDIEDLFSKNESNGGDNILDGEFDDHSQLEELTETEANLLKSVMSNIYNGLRNRGKMTADFENFLGTIEGERDDDVLKLAQSISNLVNSTYKTKTYQRLPVRIIKDNFLFKGKKKYSKKLVVIHDTSGSMGNSHKEVLSRITKLEGCEIFFIQADTEVKSYITIEDIELHEFTIKGGGGTELQPAIDFYLDNEDIQDSNLLILTDGYTDTLDFSKVNNNVLIISCSKECPLHDSYDNVEQKIIQNLD